RPIVVAGKIEARPMIYLALSYDHRIVDGREAVTFLVRVKEGLEDPARVVLDLEGYGLRSHCYRYRSRRLRLRDPRGAAWIENGGCREKCNVWRDLPQYRLHPLEGTSARLRAFRGSRPHLRQNGDRGFAAEAGSQGHDGLQRSGRRRQREGRRLPSEEEQGRYFSRRGAHHCLRQGRSQRC